MSKTKTPAPEAEAEFTLGVAESIPPVRRGGESKYDEAFEKAKAIAPKAVIIDTGSRSKATSVAAYLRRITDPEEFVVEQRLDLVYLQHIAFV